LKCQYIEEIIDFGDLSVFRGATTYPCILRIIKGAPGDSFEATQIKSLDFKDLYDYVQKNHYIINRLDLDDSGWSLADNRTKTLLAKLISAGMPLGEYLRGKIYNGVKTGLNEAFVIDSETREQLISENPDSTDIIKPFLVGKDIKRYMPPKNSCYLIYIPWHFPLQNNPEIVSASSIAEAQFEKQYPALYKHLIKFKPQLMNRDKTETNIKYEWYALQRPRPDYYEEFGKPKIMLPDISARGNFTLDEDGKYFTVNAAYIIPKYDKYLLGILNSSLITFIYKHISSSYRGGYLRFIHQYLALLPIIAPNTSNSSEVEYNDRMVALVNQMLSLHKLLPKARTPHEQTALERQIEAADRQIDALVYELYGLTEEEIAIVEGRG